MIEVLSVSCSSVALATILRAVKRIMQIIQIVGPILLIVSLATKFSKLMMSPEDKKLPKQVLNSVIAAVLLFFIPMFVNLTMSLLGENFNVSSCWNSVSNANTSSGATYIDPYGNTQRKSFISNSSDYEKGKPQQTTNSTNTDTGSTGGKVPVGSHEYKNIVWDSSNVTRISNLTATQLVGVLNSYGGRAGNFIPYAQDLITAEKKYSVNVFFLIGIEALETGWVTSNLAKNCNNLGGVKATKSHPAKSQCGSFGYYNSKAEFIDYHAAMLHKSYLTPGGSYYHGTSPYDVVISYCGNSSSWPVSVIQIGDKLFNQVPNVVK